MAFNKRDGAGLKFEKATGTNLDWLGPWVVVPGVMGTVPLPGGTAASYDATRHDDVLAGQITKQKRAALADIPDLQITMMWDPAATEHQALLTDMGARTVRQYRFTAFGVAAPKYGVSAQIVVGSPQADINGGLTAQITLIVSATNFVVA
jgi:hypothetical protein